MKAYKLIMGMSNGIFSFDLLVLQNFYINENFSEKKTNNYFHHIVDQIEDQINIYFDVSKCDIYVEIKQPNHFDIHNVELTNFQWYDKSKTNPEDKKHATLSPEGFVSVSREMFILLMEKHYAGAALINNPQIVRFSCDSFGILRDHENAPYQ